MPFVTDHPWVLVAALAALCAILAALRTGRARPRPGQVWFAQVPFDDGSGSKDRPVLILEVHGRSCTAAAFTSQSSAERHHAVRVPHGVPGLDRASWVKPSPTTLPVRSLRRCAGDAGPGLVTWYAQHRRG